MSTNELTHHGIKGMRWGVRRSKAQLARAGGSSAKSSPTTAKKVVGDGEKTDYKPRLKAEELSDRELKARIQRIENEKKYNQLTAKEKSAGRKFVEDVLVNAGKQALTSFVNKQMTNALNSLMDGSSGGGNKTKTNNTNFNQGGKTETTGNRSTPTSTGLIPVSRSSGPRIDPSKIFGR